jgi:hypothetical protein
MHLTNRQKFIKKYNLPDKSYSLQELANITKVPLNLIQQSFNRGIGAFKTNLASVRLKNFSKNPDTKKFPASSRLSPEQWAYGRVYSFLMNSKADKDLQKYKFV